MQKGALAVTTATGMGPLPELLAEAAGDRAVARAFQRADLPLSLVAEKHTLLPMAALVDLFSEAGREAGDRLFGLKVGLQMGSKAYGLWMDYGRAAPSLREALRRLAWSITLHQSGPAVLVEERGRVSLMTYRMPGFRLADKRQHSDHVVPTMIDLARRYLGKNWNPAWIELDYPGDSQAGVLSDALQTELRFGGRAISLPVRTEDLDRRPAGGSAAGESGPTALDLIAQLERRALPPIVAAVEACISIQLLEGRAGIDGVARRLDTSVRSLQRALDLEGLSYRALLESFRMRKAAELLSERKAAVTEVAFALGYTDPANFSRAFRRWTGHPPSRPREAR